MIVQYDGDINISSVQLVVDWTLVRGVARQIEAFKEGFSSVFSISIVQGLFYPSEVGACI